LGSRYRKIPATNVLVKLMVKSFVRANRVHAHTTVEPITLAILFLKEITVTNALARQVVLLLALITFADALTMAEGIQLVSRSQREIIAICALAKLTER